MEATSLNLWGLLLWFLYGFLAHWFSGWQLQHVWHFHPFLRWFVGHFWHAALVAALLDVIANPSSLVVTCYFIGTLLVLEFVRRKNPIDVANITRLRPVGAMGIQDVDGLYLAIAHLIGLSIVL